MFISQLHPDTIGTTEALKRLEEVKRVADAGYAVCDAVYDACRGAESSTFQPFTRQQKTAFQQSAKSNWRHGVAQIIVSVAWKVSESPIFLPSKGVAVSIAVFGTSSLTVASKLRELANDPPEDDFQDIPRPQAIQLPEITVDELINDNQALALNQWLSNMADSVSYASALASAINRAQGAEVAGDTEARQKQIAAARTYASGWADTLAVSASIRAQVAVALNMNAAINISPTDLLTIQAEIIESGWPEDVTDFLTHFHVNTEEQAQILQEATSVFNNVTSVSGSLSDNLNDPDLALQESELIAALREFSIVA
jgi:hypothetical protein